MATGADEHRYFEGMAVAHVLGGLDESDGRVFRSHLLECPDCRAHVGELRALAHDLADAERDERRARAARSVETKRRETDEGDDDDDLPSAPSSALRYPRLLMLLVVAALVGLATWNFMLRTTIANQQATVDNLTDAAELLEFGTAVGWTAEMGIDARIRVAGDRLVLLVKELPDDTPHSIEQFDAQGETLDSRAVRSSEGVIYGLVQLSDSADRLELVRLGPELGEGQTVLTADLP